MEVSTRKEKITACVLVAFSIIYLLGCLNTSVGRIGNPGAGLIPRLIAVCLIIFTGLNAFHTFRRRPGPSSRREALEVNYSSVIGIAIVVLLFPLLLHTLKAITATFVSSFAMLRLMHYKTALKCLIISLSISASVYIIFALILGVTFPSGPIEQLVWRIYSTEVRLWTS
jgi:putative tricarboxylic transport membrane protein